MLHVRMRGLHADTGLSYAECTRIVLAAVADFSPRAVLVPAFTYSFTRSGVFHRRFSRSEAGRFSEEVRLNHARYRTPDPIFSVMDTMDWLESQQGMRFDGAFEPECVWERLWGEDAVIVNLGIESMVATQIHYVERLAGAPWRTHVSMPGVVYEDDTHFRHVDYDFYARDMAQNRLLDWPRIRRFLEDDGALRTGEALGVNLAWISCRELHSRLEKRVAEMPEALVVQK